jgi:hypothetical protein
MVLARVGVVAVLCAVLFGVAGACSKAQPAERPSAKPADDAPAGTVRELTGDVTATRPGATARKLAVGDGVFADDTIATAAGAHVVIELAHNGVAWTLEEGKQRRVDASAAWSAKAGSGDPAIAEASDQDPDRTEAAGRHTEHEAAETGANLPKEEKAPPAMQPPPRTVAPAPKQKGDDIGMGDIGTMGHGSGAGTGQGFGSGHGRLGGAHVTTAPKLNLGAPTVSGPLPPEVISRIVRQSFGRYRLCYEDGLKKNPTLAGSITIKIVIAADGSSSATQGGTDLSDTDVVGCVVRNFSGMTFPAQDKLTTVSLKLTFAPADSD